MKKLFIPDDKEIIPFTDFNLQYKKIKGDISQSVKKVLESQSFILGKELSDFESQFSKYLKVRSVLGVGSGTDGLIISLKALGVKDGDEVILPTFGFVATALAVSEVGATPIFVDSDRDTYLIDPESIIRNITKKTKAIIAVHLYGAICDMNAILKIAKKHKLFVIEDACQAHGSTLDGNKAGTMSDIGVFSFYPSKNMGAYGDAGAICTNDQKLHRQASMIRNYGQVKKYKHVVMGINSRMDEIQASILKVKLAYLDDWNKRRNEIVEHYNNLLNNNIKSQLIAPNSYSCYHVFAIEIPKRDQLMKLFENNNVQALIHYPIPIHLQTCFKGLGHKRGDFPNAETLAKRVISLPLYPFMKLKNIKRVANIINTFSS